MSTTNAKSKRRNRALEKRKQLLQRLKALDSYIDKKKLEAAVSEEERKFIIAQGNKKYRESRGKLQIPMVKTAQNIDGRRKQLLAELKRVNTHLGARYLKKGSIVPTGWAWSWKPEPGTDRMINPDYVRDYDPEVIAARKKSGEIDPTTTGITPTTTGQTQATALSSARTVNEARAIANSSTDLDEGTATKNAATNNAPASLARQRNLKALQNNQSQIGNLKINPGGIVGRWDDVRTSDGRSTALSIAQQDFMGIKKGEQLGVLTRAQRRKYDRDVLKIGG